MSSRGIGNDSRVRPAVRRLAANVSLDLRVPGRAAALALGENGALVAWTEVLGDSDARELASQAVGKLAVRPKTLRVLLGSHGAQVGIASHDGEPGEAEILETLLAEGHEPLVAPAVAVIAVSPGAVFPETWWVGACAATTLDPLADSLIELTGSEPAFVIDQLLVGDRLEAASALVEYGDAGLLIAARPGDSAPLLRSVTTAMEPEQAASEVRETLRVAGSATTTTVLGAQRDVLCEMLTDGGSSFQLQPLPGRGSETLPEGFELLWLLATAPDPPTLRGSRIARRRTSLEWARRVTWAAIVLGFLGALLVATGLRTSWAGRAERRALESVGVSVQQQMELLQETAELAEEVQRLREDLAAQTLPWPRLAPTVVAVARDFPPTAGCRSLAVTDGELELEARVRGAQAASDLEGVRRILDHSAGLSNLSWDEPVEDPEGLIHQVFRGKVQTPRNLAPEAS